MFGSIYSIHDNNGTGVITEVQVHLAAGMPYIQLIGSVGKSLDESRERIKSAFASCNIDLPRKKITINISPADIVKNGAHYDLAIAIAILTTSRQLDLSHVPRSIILGELGLDGSIRPIKGLLGKIRAAKAHGFSTFIIPAGNNAQASLIPNIQLHPADNIKTLVEAFQAGPLHTHSTGSGAKISTEASTADVDFSDIVGQTAAKRALEIAAAGQHNVLLSGPPGVGKSMLAKAMIGIMPPLTREEVITVTHLHSLIGNKPTQLIRSRPVRAPHHTVSHIALTGGGAQPRPGEISLAHTGVLLLDELPEFKRASIESLRQPLEDRSVNIMRANYHVTYPANFILVATKNPCPCGYSGSTKLCNCSPIELDRYRKKLSGPILDRIDLHVTVDAVDHTHLLSKQSSAASPSGSSRAARARVARTIARQQARFAPHSNSPTIARNGTMTNQHIKIHANLEPAAKQLLDTAAQKLNLSARVYMKTIKLARTIADLSGSVAITPPHIAEALRYRPT